MLDSALAGQIFHNPVNPPLNPLSLREQEVLRLVARGKTNREIAAQLILGEETVKTHVASILAKLDLNNRAQIATYALKQGWISFEDI